MDLFHGHQRLGPPEELRQERNRQNGSQGTPRSTFQSRAHDSKSHSVCPSIGLSIGPHTTFC